MDGFYVPGDFWMGTFFIFLPIFGVNQILFFSAENYGKKALAYGVRIWEQKKEEN